MATSEATHLLGRIRDRIDNSAILRASLCHISCRDAALELIAENKLDPAWIEIWPTLGKDVLELYSARGVIGSVGCESSGEASPGAASLKRLVTDKLSSMLQEHDLGRFGDSMPLAQRTPGVYDDVTAQFVGCWTQLDGYSIVREALLKPMFELTPITLPSSKDPKTLLQETLQGRKLPTASYSVVATTGPANDQTFTVCVEAFDGLTSKGSGRSKKEAERDAARIFLATHLSGVRYPKGSQLRPNFNVQAAAILIPRIPQAPIVAELVNHFQLPPWAHNLLALAFVHRSFPMAGSAGPFGKDNRLLAFVGSNVINWAIPHVMLESLSPTEIQARGGIAPLRAKVGSEEALGIITANLFSREVHDTGPGLSESQLESLKLGNALASTSRRGPGIGLLTVLLTTKELRGEVQFANHKLGGLVVRVLLPSMIQDTGAECDTNVVNEIGESVVIDEDSLGR